jgi:hypothetical protein
MRLRCICVVLAMVVGELLVGAQEPLLAPAPLDTVLLRQKIWETTSQELAPDLSNLGFEWLSPNREIARSVLSGLVFQQRPLTEAILMFRSGRLAEARLLYFNRGDSGTVRQEQFEQLLEEIIAELTALTARQPIDRGRDPGNAVKAEGRLWDTGYTRFLLEWSATKGSHLRAIPFKAEFIRLTVRPSVLERAPLERCRLHRASM